MKQMKVTYSYDIQYFKHDESLKNKLNSQIMDEAQVIVHCLFAGRTINDKIRVWKTTYLYSIESNHRSKLLHIENISLYPNWKIVGLGQMIQFTLIFSGLPKTCKQFNLIEEIPEPGGFNIKGLERNQTDVYYVFLNDNI